MISRHSLGSHWPIRELGEIVDFLDHKRRPVTGADRMEGPYPYYGANGQQGTISGYLFDEPLILLAEDGGHFDDPDRGIAYSIAGKTWVNNHAHVLRPKSGIDLKYLCRILENYDVSPFVTGTTRGKLTKAGASIIPIPIAPLTEQQRIASILDQTEALRTKRRQVLAKLDHFSISIFDESNCSRSLSAAYSIVRLSEVVDFRTGKLDSNAAVIDGEYPFFTCSRDESRIDRYAFDCEALLLAGNNAVGDFTVKHYKGKFNAYQRTYVITIRDGAAEYSYLKVALEAQLSFLKQMSKGTGTRYLTLEILNNLKIALPPIEVQRNFSSKIERIRLRKQTLLVSSFALDRFATSLQNRAFNGEL